MDTKNSRFFRNNIGNKGFTLIETLVGIALLGIVMVLGSQGYDFIKKMSNTVSSLDTVDRRTNEIIENVRATLPQQVVSFNSDPVYIQNILSASSLTMAWSLRVDDTVSNCPTCPGRYGYIITPIKNESGLNLVTIVFTHKDWGTEPKKFEFVVTR